MKDQSIIDWLESLGSKTPTPGGGATAGLYGAIAAAQAQMVYEYSDAAQFSDSHDFKHTISNFLELADQDAKSYGAVRDAYKSKDAQAIENALAAAIKPSVAMIQLTREVFEYCEDNKSHFNKNLLADLIVALAGLGASTEAAQSMLKINKNSMKQADNITATAREIVISKKLIDEIQQLKTAVSREIT